MSQQSSIPDHWTAAQGLGFLYVTFACADGDLPESEIATIFAKLDEWDFIECVPGMMEDVMGFWKDLNNEETAAHFTAILGFLKNNMTDGNRRAVLNDLMEVAAADGKLHENEAGLLAIVKESLAI